MAYAPVAIASSQSLQESHDQIDALFSRAFDAASDDRQAANKDFLEITSIAESALVNIEGLDAQAIRNLQVQAGNAYYYLAENEHWMAKSADDPAPFTASKIAHLEKALAFHSKVFSNGADGLLVAEYFFGTSLLVEYGLESDDPRTKQWAKANVHAGRLRIDGSIMLGIDPPNSAKFELIQALLDYAKVTGDASASQEALDVARSIPPEDRGYSLRRRLKKEGLEL